MVALEPTQNPRFTRGEADNLAAPLRFEATEVDHAAVCLEDFRFGGGRGCTAAEGLDPRQELTNRKGLGQIVVGARLEPGDLVVLGSAGGEHQDRQQRSRTAQATADLDAVEIRQHEIEEHEVEGLAGAAVDRGSPVFQGDDIIPRRAQKVGETLAQSPFVLDDENPHASG